MNTKHTFEQLQELKLYGMAGCYETQLNLPIQKQADAHTLVAMMTEAEATSKINQRTNLYLRLARLRYQILPEQIHCSHERNLSKEQLLFLSELSFVDNGAMFWSQVLQAVVSLIWPAPWGARPVCWGIRLIITP